MSNYGSMPARGPNTAPGAPNPNHHAQQQQQGHQPGAPTLGSPAHVLKSGGAFGQMMNQAVTTGKPMLSKFSKTISSRLAGKQPAGGPPQHLQSYANYQQHQGQDQQGHYSPQPQQQQWLPPPHPPPAQQPQAPPPPAPNAYAPQPSPYQQSNYATPVSAHSGQSHHFSNQQQQPNGPPPGALTYSHSSVNQGGNVGPDQQSYTHQGQFAHTGMAQGQFQQMPQSQVGQYANQQTGVVGSTLGPEYNQTSQNPPMGHVSPEIPPNKPVMQPQGSNTSGPEQLPPANTQQHLHSPMPPQQYSYSSGPSQQSHPPVTSPSPQQDHQQWSPASSPSPQGHGPVLPAPHSPPPQQTRPQPQQPPQPSVSPQPNPASNPSSPHVTEETSQFEFIAELPADIGNMSPVDQKPGGAKYQACQSQDTRAVSPTNSFSIARRTTSASSLPLSDPWRFADPMTEQPTREFYIIADLLFDALDRKFEPHTTGMLEAPKILRSWIELTQDAHRLFSYSNYTALARMWSLEGIPHIMVPVQSSLAPVWHFNQHSHAQDVAVVAEPQSTYATYVPALNRAGWYKFFFLEMNAGPDDLGKLLAAVCADTYKPGVLNHPDLNRRDRSDIPALHARAAEIQALAIRRVCDEASAALMSEQSSPGATGSLGPSGATSAPNQHQGSAEEMARLLHEMQMASNDTAVRSVMDGDTTYRTAQGQPGGYSRLV